MKTSDVRRAVVIGILLGSLLSGCGDDDIYDAAHPSELVAGWVQQDVPNPVTVTAADGSSYTYQEALRGLTLEWSGRFTEHVEYGCLGGTCPGGQTRITNLTGYWSATGGMLSVSGLEQDGAALPDGTIPARPYSFDGTMLLFEGGHFARN